MIRETSRDAYQHIKRDLQRREVEVLTAAWAHFKGKTFTRKDIARALGWEINRVTGRVLTLIERGELQELEERRDGSYLLQIRLRQAALFPLEQPEAPQLNQLR